MHGAPQRGQGWWYQGGRGSGAQWSYSWSVAHSLHMYLASGKAALPVKRVTHPAELEVGDIILYDWDGNGTWGHSVIVTGYSAHGPLVHAHTDNSRFRLWAYRDSRGWSERTKYQFFHIDA